MLISTLLAFAMLAPTFAARAANSDAETIASASAREAPVAEAGQRLDREAEAHALIRLGEAQRELGQTAPSLVALGEALAIAIELDRPILQAAALGARAATEIDASKLAAAEADLERALGLLAGGSHSELEAALQNERGRLAEARNDPGRAASAYAASAESSRVAGDALGSFRASANLAYLLARSRNENAHSAFDSALESGIALTERRDAAETWLRLGRAGVLMLADTPPRVAGPHVAACFEHVLALAVAASDPSLRSRARGGMALVHASAGQYDDALALTGQALLDATRAQQEALIVSLRVQSARIARRAGDRDAAIDQLEQASAAIAAERALLLPSSPFAAGEAGLDSVDAGVLMELVDLLLARAEENGEAASQRDLAWAQQALERFKAQELRDYFHDDCVDAFRSRVKDPALASASAAVVYPISLPDRLAILVSSGGRIEQRRVDVSAAALDEQVEKLRGALAVRTSRRYVRPARQLHEWLMAPIESHLSELGIDTLVFVPGGSLRTIPMAALLSDEGFLVERYAIATTPGLELTDPRAVDPEQVVAFLGGLSESVAGYPALPYVPRELEAVRDAFGGELLLDDRFSHQAIRNELASREFGIVHMATHGEFGASSDESFLLTWDGRLSMSDLAESVGAFRYRETPLELLVLSACDTATGGDFAGLGLAGVAVQAGARTALGSLWPVQDDATAQLLAEFYRALRVPGTSRAHALRHSQRELIRRRRYDHPAYWAAFLLIGSWL